MSEKGNKVRHSYSCLGGDALAISAEKNQENDYVVFGANIKLVAFVERTHVLWRMFLCS